MRWPPLGPACRGMSEVYGQTDEPEELAGGDAAFPPGAASGMRYPEDAMRIVNR